MENLVSIQKVAEFLQSYHAGAVANLYELSSGKHSEAFSYSANEKECVVRFNESQRGFLKDAYAYEHFSSLEIIIPKIHGSGTYKEGIFYSLSEKIFGESVRDKYNQGDFSSLYLQFETIERIKNISIEESTGFGEWGLNINAPYKTMTDFIQSLYHSQNFFNWNELYRIEFFDKSFTDYLDERISHSLQFLDDERALMHGDFGGENLFIKNGAVSGIIDWEKSRYGDHFLDVGRVVLYCPNREATTKTALSFYQNKGYKYYKERILLGVYFTMLHNYASAAIAGNKVSCANSPSRIKQIEELLWQKTKGEYDEPQKIKLPK